MLILIVTMAIALFCVGMIVFLWGMLGALAASPLLILGVVLGLATMTIALVIVVVAVIALLLPIDPK